jgi:hypothetical protein
MVFTTSIGTVSMPGTCCANTTGSEIARSSPRFAFTTCATRSNHPEDGWHSRQAIQRLLGHASVRTTQDIYIHLTPGAEKSAAKKMIVGSVPVLVAVKKRENSPELNRN